MNDLSILCSAASREYSRIPALVWKHPENHSVLVRGGPVSNIFFLFLFLFYYYICSLIVLTWQETTNDGSDVIAAISRSVSKSRSHDSASAEQTTPILVSSRDGGQGEREKREKR